jgi:hypothetical protein
MGGLRIISPVISFDVKYVNKPGSLPGRGHARGDQQSAGPGQARRGQLPHLHDQNCFRRLAVGHSRYLKAQGPVLRIRN